MNVLQVIPYFVPAWDYGGPVQVAQCGLSVEPENAELRAQAILKLYKDSSLAEELGENGRKHAERHFSLEACTEKYEQLFEELCGKQ